VLAVTAHRLQLLIVEDSLADAKLLRLWLGRSPVIGGIEVVRDGSTAMRYLRAEGEFAQRVSPDLVLLDSQLPDLNGLELLEQIRNVPSGGFAVLMLSGARNSEAAQRAHELGAIGYLIKPSDVDEFADLVKRIEGFAVSRDARP
jgi:DNA-binding response OmpR family regulator